jgi:hypothetical protein
MSGEHASDPSFDPATSPMGAVGRTILQHPRVGFQADKTCGALVLVLADELLVLASARPANQLPPIATLTGTLGGAAPGLLPPGSDDVEIWRLKPGHDSIAEARKLRTIVKTRFTPGGPLVSVPSVTPNHVAVVAPNYDICPHGIPHPHVALPKFAPPFGGPGAPRVSILDTGFIGGHPVLEERGHIEKVFGRWHDSATGIWADSPPDAADADGDGRLDGVAGHGTFIAGLVAAGCPQAEIRVVGLRHECLPASPRPSRADAARLFSSEVAVCANLLAEVGAGADVVSCGFAFPTLDGLPSLPLELGFAVKSEHPAIVAPTGNESTSCRYWPAAHSRVVGVASTNARGTAAAGFSNWGPWADCCARGAEVVSTYLDFTGFPDGHHPRRGEAPWRYERWASWSGTSFAAPKVAAAIAATHARRGMPPRDAYRLLLRGGEARVRVDRVAGLREVDPGRTSLPHLQLG